MKRALIEPTGRVAQVVAPGSEFPVAPPLAWVDAPDTATADDSYDGGAFVPRPTPPRRTAAERAELEIASSPALKGLVQALADRFGIAEADMVIAIKAKL